MANIMSTGELSAYLKLSEITFRQYAFKGIIPAIRFGLYGDAIDD